MDDLNPCPLCGALPCDWVDDPHKAEVGLCWTLAKIREVLGVGEKPMLGELPDIIATTIAAQAAELQRLREGMTRAEAAFTLIAGSHWERFGIDQTDVEQVPDLSSDEAMNVARDFLAYDDFPATSQVRHD